MCSTFFITFEQNLSAMMYKTFLLFAFALFFYHTSPAQQAVANNIVFILDGSGSMWQKSGTEYKIATAKSVMKDLVNKLPEETQLGLVVYGHRRKEDCKDIETLQPLSALDKKQVAAMLDGINPQGKTPIALSIQHTLDLIKSVKNHVNIILVSDGLETCEGKACDLVSKAKEQGVQITMHVIGFGIAEKDLSALECIAQAGGGQYIPANNAGELTEALNKTIEKPITGGGYLSVHATAENKLIDVNVKVYPKGQKKELATARTYTNKETNPRNILLPAGTYELSTEAIGLDGRPLQTFSDIIITKEDTLLQRVDFSFGTFEILITRNDELSDATIALYKAGTKERVAGGRSYRSATSNPAKYKIVPGNYDIEIKSVEISNKSEKRFENQLLKSSSTQSLSHNFESGELLIGVQQGETLVDATIRIYDSKSGKQVGAGRTYAATTSNPQTFTLEPGAYRVEIGPVNPKGLAKKEIEILIEPKKETKKIITY